MDRIATLLSARLCLVLGSALSLNSCVPQSAAAFVPPELTDQAVSDKIDDELWFDHGVVSSQIDVITIDGIVTLSGSVDNVLAKERAARIAETVRGVRAVVNRIVVKPAKHRDDAEIERDIAAAFRIEPVIEAEQVAASVRDGTVLLTGTVDSYQERALVAKVAKGVRGVKALDDRLTIDYKTTRSDAEIDEEVEAALRWNLYVDHFLIDVQVKDGRVTLSGNVGSAAEKRLAEAIVRVAGVQDVDAEKLSVSRWARDPELRGNKYELRSPGDIQDAVKTALLYDPRVMSFNVEANVLGGTVTLRGKVDNLEAKRAAEQDARNTVGVIDVINRLKVRSQDEPPPDSEIVDDVQGAFRRDPYVDRFEISVTSVDGTVYLYGTVDSYYEKYRADDLASKVPGVVDVQNHLTVDFRDAQIFDPYVDDGYVDACPLYGYERRAPFRTDAQLKDAIEREMWWSPFVDAEDVTVTVTNGVAALTGTVNSWSERRAATENAYEGGATLVDNDLKVE